MFYLVAIDSCKMNGAPAALERSVHTSDAKFLNDEWINTYSIFLLRLNPIYIQEAECPLSPTQSGMSCWGDSHMELKPFKYCNCSLTLCVPFAEHFPEVFYLY